MDVSNNAGNKPTTDMSEATKKTQGTLSGKRPQNHDIMEGRKGTRQTWVEFEEDDPYTTSSCRSNTEKDVVPNPVT
ncbi:uncharacterized protein LOC113273949 isoform X2 [Papaver somniferum]|nr:uncharacterized protein LOC113273949 isoform X2 [Papaver somniferum]